MGKFLQNIIVDHVGQCYLLARNVLQGPAKVSGGAAFLHRVLPLKRRIRHCYPLSFLNAPTYKKGTAEVIGAQTHAMTLSSAPNSSREAALCRMDRSPGSSSPSAAPSQNAQ